MKNSIYKRKVITDKLKSVFYWVTMVIFLIIASNITLTYMPGKDWLAFIIIFGAIIIHYMFILCVKLLMEKCEDKKFVKEYNQIEKGFHETDNAEAYLDDLLNMRYSPRMKKSINRFYLSMATALYRTNEKEGALTFLGTIQTSD